MHAGRIKWLLSVERDSKTFIRMDLNYRNKWYLIRGIVRHDDADKRKRDKITVENANNIDITNIA